tara:strand:+ start:10897 stop:11661 length:765 start_codon:yes stop_codon:yes gene_type:complete
MSSLPNHPGERRGIVVLDQHEIDNCSRRGDTEFLTDNEVHVLCYPVTEENASDALQNILASGLARPGTILIQSPFDHNEYVDAAEASQYFALAKHTILSNFCQLLGATRVSVTQMDVVTNGKVQTIKLEAGVEAYAAKGGGEFENEMTEKLSSQISLVDEYTGSDADTDSAEVLLRSCHLMGDSNMKSLLQARKAVGNPLTRRTIQVNLSTEANKNLKVVGRLEIPTATVSAEYKSTLEQTTEYKLTLEVLFPG